ncbi:DNA repair protein RAD51 homolog 4 isoform X4 [Macrotis lagotis]|uniref:DNA repair protein RAD51 homolog 4 isoform X4 n=1 Tax=Macrotis lagotis TaxID=92651 RepID=UPI003D69F1FE
MGVLRAGLCPGLTQEMIQLLRGIGIRTVVDLVSAELEEVSRKCSLSYKAGALQRIHVVCVFDIFQMMDTLQDLRGSISQQVTSASGSVKIVVVDSVSAVVSPFLGGQHGEGLALMMQLARELKTLARELGIAVLVTNHVTRDRDSGKLRPALGRSWSFVPSTRVLLEVQAGSGAPHGCRVASLTKSSRQPTGIQEIIDIGSCQTPEQSSSLEGSKP